MPTQRSRKTLAVVSLLTLLTGCQSLPPMDAPTEALAAVGVYVSGPDRGPNACSIDLNFMYEQGLVPHEVGLLYEIGKRSDDKIYDVITLQMALPGDASTETVYGLAEKVELGEFGEPCENVFTRLKVFCISGSCPGYQPWQHPQGYQYDVDVSITETDDAFDPTCLASPWLPQCNQ